jgi:Uma2 family endonuclease
MAPIGSRHAACVKRLNNLFSRQVGDRAVVGVQDPVRLDEYSEPQPDLTLLRPRPDYYAGGHPGPEDVLLVVEVAETSAEYDRQIKVPLYARAGIREVWLVDLAASAVEVYREPTPEGYRQVRRFGRGETLSPEALPDINLALDDILGPGNSREANP